MSVIHGHIARPPRRRLPPRAAPPDISPASPSPFLPAQAGGAGGLCRIVAKARSPRPPSDPPCSSSEPAAARSSWKGSEQRYQSAHGVREDLRRCLEVLRGPGPGRAGEAPPPPGFELGGTTSPAPSSSPTGALLACSLSFLCFASPCAYFGRRLFGREELLRRLADAHTAAERAGAPRLRRGPSGAGKTRLVAGFVEELAERAAERAPGLLRGKYDAGPARGLQRPRRCRRRTRPLGAPAGLGPIRASLASDWRPSQLLADGERLAAARARAVRPSATAPRPRRLHPETRFEPAGSFAAWTPGGAAALDGLLRLLAASGPRLFLDDVQSGPSGLPPSAASSSSPSAPTRCGGAPVAHAMREIRESGVHVEVGPGPPPATLQFRAGGRSWRWPLGEGDANALLASALRCPPEAAAPLARLVHAKTGGTPVRPARPARPSNPPPPSRRPRAVFIRSFLATLHSERKIRADVEAGAWRWDVAEIEREATPTTCRPAPPPRPRAGPSAAAPPPPPPPPPPASGGGHARGFIGHLDPGTQRALKARARGGPPGQHLRARLLAAAAGLPMTAVRAALAAARRSRLVDAASPSGGVHRFVHDRVQQACSCLVPPRSCRRCTCRSGGGSSRPAGRRRGRGAALAAAGVPGPRARTGRPTPTPSRLRARARRRRRPGAGGALQPGERLVSDPAERRRLAELNARAGPPPPTPPPTRPAFYLIYAARAFFAAGVRALRARVRELSPSPRMVTRCRRRRAWTTLWETPLPALALSLLLRLVEAEYQCGDTRAGTRRERLDAARLRLNILSASNQRAFPSPSIFDDRPLTASFSDAGEYGVYLSAEGHPTPDEIAAAHEGVRGALRARGLAVPDLAGLPLGAAEVDGDLHRLLTNAVEVVPVLYLLARFELYQVLVAAVARLCVESGRGGDAAAPGSPSTASPSPNAHSKLPAVPSCLARSPLPARGPRAIISATPRPQGFQYLYEEGESFVRAAAALSARDGVSDFCRRPPPPPSPCGPRVLAPKRAQGRTAVFLFAPFPMGETWCEKLPALATGFTASAAVGDFNNALYVLNQYHWVSFFHGKPLAENAAFAARHEAFVRKCVNHELEQSVVAASRHYSVLLDAEALLAAADMGPEAAQRGYYMRATYFSFRFVTLLALGRFREAAAAFPAFAAVVPYNAFAWFEGLYELTARLGFWRAALTEEERAAAAAIGRASVDHLRVLASHNRIYTCRSLFLERLPRPASSQGSGQVSAPNVAGLAHEAAAALCERAGAAAASRAYLREALADYAAWGARTKARAQRRMEKETGS
eukprot:tig00020499_g9786.t1